MANYLFVAEEGGCHPGGKFLVAHLILPDADARLQLVKVPFQAGCIEDLFPEAWHTRLRLNLAAELWDFERALMPIRLGSGIKLLFQSVISKLFCYVVQA